MTPTSPSSPLCAFQSLLTGMNTFLKQLSITFRRDPSNYRPRINKAGSTKDHEQKRAGTFFYMDD